jgi:diadenosine tetraphosphate (Ap4A) HIT family hydrolase
MQFSEADGFSHLHLHVVPRMADQPDLARGPRVFTYLAEDSAQWPPEAERDDLARSVRAALA